MRTSALTILGLVAAAVALPAKGTTDVDVEKRDDVSFGQFSAPLQVREPQRGRGGGGGPGKDRGGGNNGGNKNGGGGGNNNNGPWRGDGGNGGGGDDDWDYDDGRSRGGGNSGGPSIGGGNSGGPPNGGGKNNGGWGNDDNDKGSCRMGGCGGGGSGGGPPPDVPYEPNMPQPPPPQPPSMPSKPDSPGAQFPGDPDGDFPDDPQHEVTREDIVKAQLELDIMEMLLRTITNPAQREAIERGVEQLKAFLKKYGGGDVDVDVPNPGVITVFHPGLKKRAEVTGHPSHDEHDDIFAILGQWTILTTERYNKHKPPPLPVYLIACQLAEILLDAGIDIDMSILDAWSHFQIADKVKRQGDGIFALPGSCNIDDIIGLETILATIMLIYGDEPPAHIQSLRNAVVAALLFCGAAGAETGGMIPDRPGKGGGIIPDIPSEGGEMQPDKPSKGSPIVPDKPSNGGQMVPDKPSAGGKMKPDVPSEGGAIVPDDPEEGAPLKPSDRKKRSVKRQHPSIDMDALVDALAQLEDAYGKFGSGDIPMPIFIIMQTIVALLQSYGVKADGWPDLVGSSVMIPPTTPGAPMIPDLP